MPGIREMREIEECTSSETSLNAYGMTTKEVMVYEQIKKDILNNEFKPGTVLVERKLTEKYQVSRSPVRYALRQLVRDGLLSGEPGKGDYRPGLYAGGHLRGV